MQNQYNYMHNPSHLGFLPHIDVRSARASGPDSRRLPRPWTPKKQAMGTGPEIHREPGAVSAGAAAWWG
ncbi:hypothetical protein SSCG_03018 [Streptomyces clavuligerus]|nr:hypothetical protein SSCG_03018 [Streptomyces clavuligerus]